VLDVEPLSLRDSTGQTLLHYYQTRGLFDIDDIDALNSVCDNNGILPFLLLCATNANNEKFIKKNGRSLRDLAHHSASVANAIGVVQYLARLELYDTHICKFLLGLGMPNLEQRDTGVPGSPTILHQLLAQDIGTARIIVFMRTVRYKSDDFEAYINMKTIVDTENKQERTALEMAIETGRFAVVKMLLQNNAQLYGKVLAVDAFEYEQYHLALKLAASEWSSANILSAKQIQVAIHNDMSMDQEEIISIIETLSKQQKEEFLKHMCQVGAGSTEPSDFTANCSTVQMLCHYRKSNLLQYLFTLLPNQQQELEDMLDLVVAPEPIFNNNILHFLCNRYALICLMATNKETTSGQQKPLPKIMISMLTSHEYVRSKHLFSQKNKKGFTPAEMLPSQNKGIVTEYLRINES
jgi:ankyrin repeat protein